MCETVAMIVYCDWSVCVDVQPTEAELPVWTRVEAILKYSDTVLYELQQYKGAANEIRDVSTDSI